MNKETLVLFSGGKDSFYLSLLMIEKGYKTNLVIYENGCGLKPQNAMNTAKRIQKRYGKDRVEIIGVRKIDAILREFIRLYYNNKPSENLQKYGELPISQFNCLACRLSMYVMSIIIAKQKDIKLIVDGARSSQKFAIEQEKLLEQFENFFENNNLKIEFPIKDLKDDFELKNSILIRGFVPKTTEPQCLLGMPLDENEIDKDIIESAMKVFDKLLIKKADELIERYKNVELSGEYL